MPGTFRSRLAIIFFRILLGIECKPAELVERLDFSYDYAIKTHWEKHV